jgi:methyltransferase (TIGR00027 family)
LACTYTTFPSIDLKKKNGKSPQAVRTKYIDDFLTGLATPGCGLQFVNLGAGLDTRACRLPCYANFDASFEVDLEETIVPKALYFEQLGAAPLCPTAAVAADLLDSDVLAEGLGAAGFDAASPAVFLAEGLVMYLGSRAPSLVAAVSGVAARGSTLLLNFMDASDAAASVAAAPLPPGTQSPGELRGWLEPAGWTDLHFHCFGDAALHYGRFKDGLPPNKAFSFVVCTKA